MNHSAQRTRPAGAAGAAIAAATAALARIFPARKSSRGRWRTHSLGTSPKPGLPQLDLEGEASILAKTRRSPSKVAASSLTESSREAPEPLAVMPE